jgi:hypothetical protein
MGYCTYLGTPVVFLLEVVIKRDVVDTGMSIYLR